MNNLSSVLSYLMSVKGIKCAELGRKTGVGQPVVYRLMTGVTENPQVLTIKPIAEYFGVSLDQLLGITPLNNQAVIDSALLHSLNSKLTTIKTIASILADLLPTLVDGYQKALSANLIGEELTAEILPLLPLNAKNLLKTTIQMQELLSAMKKPQDE
ncbi:MAG: helix-turn-helix transcriptional regulator [Gammaproteobacteria bacterium]